MMVLFYRNQYYINDNYAYLAVFNFTPGPIVDEMENMDIGIEKAVKLYKEGIEISTQCSQRLENVEQQVKILKEKSDGTFKESNFKPMSEV